MALRIPMLSWRPMPPDWRGAFPAARLAVTLLAPLAVITGSDILLPRINAEELGYVARIAGTTDLTQFSVIALGVSPVITAFVLVELIALAIPRLRWRRHDLRGRVALGQATAAVALVVALVQGYFVATYLESLSAGGAEMVTNPGWSFRAMTMVSLGAGTFLLTIVAGMINEHGLGNGYAAVLVSSWVFPIVQPVLEEVRALRDWWDYNHVFAFGTLILLVLASRSLVRWRVQGNDKQPPLRLPTSSLSPISDAGGIVQLLVSLSMLGFSTKLYDLVTWITRHTHGVVYFALVAAFVPLWAWLLARPSLVADVATRAGLEAPSRGAWRRATLMSGIVLLIIAAIGYVAAKHFPFARVVAEPVTVLIATALVLDMIDDARAYRERLVPVFVLHQIQRAGIVERVLEDANIRYHIRSGNIRALFAFFGPWAPAVVLVPEADAEDARVSLAKLA